MSVYANFARSGFFSVETFFLEFSLVLCDKFNLLSSFAPQKIQIKWNIAQEKVHWVNIQGELKYLRNEATRLKTALKDPQVKS